MTEPNRKLAAIMSADVVEYTRLMADDDAATVETLQQYRAAVERVVIRHKGHVVNAPGDNILAEFASAIECVAAAIEIQKSIEGRNVEVAADRRMRFRIGVHLGDVIAEADGTIYGDGVNLAARLEALAKPGGICVSRSVYEAVEGKLDITFDDLGAHQLKNVEKPVAVYAIRSGARAVNDKPASTSWKRRTVAVAIVAVLIAGVATWRYWPAILAPTGQSEAVLTLPDRPSLAVLPFANLSDDQQQEYFADGITEDLITDLSKLPGLFVIARNSSFTYKNKPTKVQEVAESLGVQYVLEGSVRRTGDSVRINAQLIDAHGGHHLWAERYEGKVDGLFDFQDQVMAQIVANLAVELTGATLAHANNPAGTDIVAAFDAFLSGREYFRLGTADAYGKAIAEFEKSIALDPDYGRAYAALAEVWLTLHKSAWLFAIGSSFRHNFDQLNDTLAKAKARPTAHAFVVSAELLARHGNHMDALADAERAIALEPNNPDAHISKASVLNVLGRAEEAEKSARWALRLDPHHRPGHLRVLGHALFHQERYDEAVTVMERVVARHSTFSNDYVTLASAYGYLGATDKAKSAIARGNALLEKVQGRSMTVQENGMYWWHGDFFDYDAVYRARLEDGLRRAGVQEGPGEPGRYAEYRELMTKIGAEYSVEGAVKVDAIRAKTLHENGAIFVDVRGSMSFRDGHIPGALDLGLNTKLSETNLSQLVGKDDDVVFYCFAVYCPYSAYASAKALTWGYTNVYRFDGGYPGWVDAGYPTEAAPQDTAPPES